VFYEPLVQQRLPDKARIKIIVPGWQKSGITGSMYPLSADTCDPESSGSPETGINYGDKWCRGRRVLTYTGKAVIAGGTKSGSGIRCYFFGELADSRSPPV